MALGCGSFEMPSQRPSAMQGKPMGALENKIAIVRAMGELMADHSLEEIRTVDICSEAKVSRQTFYRNFEDKYAAAVWFMEEGARHSVRQIGVTCGWRTGHRRLFAFLANNRCFVERFFQMRSGSAVGRTTVERALERNFIEHYREQYQIASGHAPDSKVEFQIKAFAKMSIECIKEWQSAPTPDLSDDYIEAFLSAVPRDLYNALDIEDEPGGPPAMSLLVGAMTATC